MVERRVAGAVGDGAGGSDRGAAAAQAVDLGAQVRVTTVEKRTRDVGGL